MKSFLLLIAVGIICFQTAFAADIGVKYDSRTGDAELDLKLGKLNKDAKVDSKHFIKDLSVSFGVDKKRVEIMLDRDKMEPADAYMAVSLHRMTNQPLDHIIKAFKKNGGKGWGVIAVGLGIKPGSPKFHDLKRAVDDVKKTPGKKDKDQRRGKDKGQKKNR